MLLLKCKKKICRLPIVEAYKFIFTFQTSGEEKAIIVKFERCTAALKMESDIYMPYRYTSGE
jgi:hypothetical protein